MDRVLGYSAHLYNNGPPGLIQDQKHHQTADKTINLVHREQEREFKKKYEQRNKRTRLLMLSTFEWKQYYGRYCSFAADVQWRVITVGLPEVSIHLFRFVHVQRQVVGSAPVR